MRPVLTVGEMRAADAAALAHVTEDELVARAGSKVAQAAVRLLGGAYGRRVVVVAGPGNNGADGRVAARLLARRGASVRTVPAAEPGPVGSCDLVVDAAYGTGFRGTYEAPAVPAGVPVLAVDIPSGVRGDDGVASGRPLRATATVTFAALKPGLLQGDGRELAGAVEVADIGLAVGEPSMAVVDDADVAGLLPRRPPDTHKWATAVAVVAGSPGMEGAAALAARGASRAGAGMVRLAVPGTAPAPGAPGPGVPGPWPLEAVRLPLPAQGWADEVLEVLGRCRALVVGPGIGRAAPTGGEVRRLIAASPVPVVADADALFALGGVAGVREAVLAGRRPVVLTPHAGEFAALAGSGPGADRIGAARRLAEDTGAVVLLKGSLTVVATPSDAVEARSPGHPPVLLAAAGSSRLATAGTGDVLSGMIGAFLARGLPAGTAAAFAAHVHGRAAARGHPEGLVAGDLPQLVATWLSDQAGGRDAAP
ncbi:MAG TPA: NAD(P)H-hydrate dehydratase [Acidimicrobiales bacterium]|nr:NAD(P)H-hydrate dehydratase [Acidimicrobiales bacterium]